MRQFRRSGPKAPSEPNGGGVGTLVAPGTDGPPPAGGRSRRRYDPAWDEWQAPRRWPGILLTCLIVLAFLGVVVWHYRPHAPPPVHHKKTAFSGEGLPSPAFELSTRGAAISTYHGTQNKDDIVFTSSGHLLVLHARCDCAYSFVVTITNASAIPVAFPVSNTGSTNVTINQTLPRGRYTMKVVGSGPWQLQLIQPTAAMSVLRTAPKPFQYYSTGPSVLGPFSSANRYLYLDYLGTGTIRVYVLNSNGVRVDPAFAGRRFIEHGVALPRPPQPYFVEVDASSGFWRLFVQHTAKG